MAKKAKSPLGRGDGAAVVDSAERYLVRPLGADALEALGRCITFLRSAFAGSSASPTSGPTSADTLDAVLGESNAIELSVLDRPAEVQVDRVDRGELYNQIRHMAVLRRAIEILKASAEAGFVGVVTCHPTQSDGDTADLVVTAEPRPWYIEAYGGVRITNNRKLSEALEKLRKHRSCARLGLAGLVTAMPSSWQKAGEGAFPIAGQGPGTKAVRVGTAGGTPCGVWEVLFP